MKLVLSLLLLANTIESAIHRQNVLNSSGATVFEVFDENKIEIPNRARVMGNSNNKPSLKLSIQGAKIDEIHTENSEQWDLVLSDKTLIEIGVHEKVGTTTEYSFLWHGGGPNEKREICFHYGHNDASWYSTYESVEQKWPMDVNRVTPRTNFNNLLEHSYSTEPREFYYILEHLFLNSDGFAVLLDEAQPWFISRDTFHDDPMMCFSVNNSYPYTETIRDSNYKNTSF